SGRAVCPLSGLPLPPRRVGRTLTHRYGSEARIAVAVLGLMGATGPTSERIARDAPQVTCPVLFLVQWSDELFPRAAAFELFDALGSKDKTLHANTGTHGEVPSHEFSASACYLVRHLR
ncbi:MAG: hypothetical protein ACYDBS_06060, partial [Acidimicrobiales bacterium]